MQTKHLSFSLINDIYAYVHTGPDWGGTKIPKGENASNRDECWRLAQQNVGNASGIYWKYLWFTINEDCKISCFLDSLFIFHPWHKKLWIQQNYNMILEIRIISQIAWLKLVFILWFHHNQKTFNMVANMQMYFWSMMLQQTKYKHFFKNIYKTRIIKKIILR